MSGKNSPTLRIPPRNSQREKQETQRTGRQHAENGQQFHHQKSNMRSHSSNCNQRQRKGFNISTMSFSLWEPPGVSERMWSVNLDALISGEDQTLGGHSGWPSESLGSVMTGAGVL